LRVVLDTNVLISALITKGKPRELLDEAIEGKFQLVISPAITEELIRVYNDHQKISKYVNREQLTAFLRVVHDIAETTMITSSIDIIKKDPTDNVILATAVDGKADFIVSGDRHLLSIEEFRGIIICTVDETLKVLK
jgi:putative PIN family toxin of toxin-antitoxin system